MSKTHRDRYRALNKRLYKEWRSHPITSPAPKPIGPYFNWVRSYPHDHDTLYHHAPARRFNRDKLKRVADDPEADDGNWRDHKRPHVYYW
jgi:hypothetical protein